MESLANANLLKYNNNSNNKVKRLFLLRFLIKDYNIGYQIEWLANNYLQTSLKIILNHLVNLKLI